MSELGFFRSQKAVELLASHIEHTTLKQTALKVVTEKPRFFDRELQTLNALTNTLNNLCQVDLEEEHPLLTETPKIAAISQAAGIDFPHVFSWQDNEERKLRSATLLETTNIMNSEISSGYHTNPDKILGEHSDEDLFRFYMLDFYARWWVTNNFFGGEKRILKQDRKYSMILSNAMCEAAIVGAEAGNSDLANLTGWLLKMGWIGENVIVDEESGTKFHPELVERAKQVAKAQV